MGTSDRYAVAATKSKLRMWYWPTQYMAGPRRPVLIVLVSSRDSPGAMMKPASRRRARLTAASRASATSGWDGSAVSK